MPLRLASVRSFVLTALLVPVACSEGRPAAPQHEVTGSRAERVAAVSKLLTSSRPLPGALLDAHFLEEQIGDGELGPSDFVSFAALSVAPADVARWRAVLPPLDSLNPRPHFVAPKQPRDWWLRAADFSSLEFFSPATLTIRTTGWVGVHAASNTIYIFTFTQ